MTVSTGLQIGKGAPVALFDRGLNPLSRLFVAHEGHRAGFEIALKLGHPLFDDAASLLLGRLERAERRLTRVHDLRERRSRTLAVNPRGRPPLVDRRSRHRVLASHLLTQISGSSDAPTLEVMTNSQTTEGARMRARRQRARGLESAERLESPPVLAPDGFPPTAAMSEKSDIAALGGWIDRWSDYLQRIEGKREATYREYSASVRRFAADLEIDRVDQVTREGIERHLKRRSFAGAGPSRLRGSIIAIRRFAQYLQINGQMATNPADGIRTPRTYRKAMKVLTVPEVRRLLGLQASTLPRSRDELLAVAMFCVASGGGLRSSKLGKLLVSDVEWLDVERTIGVMLRRAKHAREDVLQRIGAQCSTMLGGYLQFRQELGGGPYLFPSTSGRPMSSDTVRRRFSMLIAARGVQPKGRHLVPKILRTTRCTHLLEKANPRDVQAFMRHASIDTTMAHYAYTSDDRVGRMLGKHDPLGKRAGAPLPVQGLLAKVFGGLGDH